MAVATWAAVIVLGPLAVAVFVWFLIDLRRGLSRDGGGHRGARKNG